MVNVRRLVMAKPKQNTEKLVVYVTPKLLEYYKQEAEGKGLNVSNLVRMILTERMNDKK
jgi:hypothetical protein